MSLVSIKSKIYEDDIFVLVNGVWVNLSSKFKKHYLRENYLKGLIEYELSNGGQNPYIEETAINKTFKKFMRDLTFYESTDPLTIDQHRIVFLNGYYDKDGFHKFKKGPDGKLDVMFSPFQITRNFNPKPKEGTKLERFINEYAVNDETNKKFLIEQVGLSMMPTNLSVAVIQFSKKSTSGKGTYMDIIQKIIGHNNQAIISAEKFFSPSAGNFVMAPTKGKLVSFVDEAPMQIAKKTTELFKEIIDSKKFIPLELKGDNADKVFNTSSIFINTNNYINIHNADEAVRLRLIIYEAEMNKDGNTVFTTQEINEILNDEDGYEWLIAEACKAIFEVLKRKGKRNEKFTIPKSNDIYWNKLAMSSKALEIVERSEELNNLFDGEIDFISNQIIKEEFMNYKKEFPNDKITLPGFKNELILLFSSKGIGIVEEARKDNRHGLKFTWTKRWSHIFDEEVESTKKESKVKVDNNQIKMDIKDFGDIGIADEINREIDELLK